MHRNQERRKAKSSMANNMNEVNVNGKEQNTSDCFRQAYTYELLTAKRSFGYAKPD